MQGLCAAALRAAIVVPLLAWGCGDAAKQPTEPGAITVIGEPSSVLHDRIAAGAHLVPYRGGDDAPILVEASAVASLGDSERSGIRRTYDAGWSVGVLDPTVESVHTIEELVDPSPLRLHVAPRPETKLLVHVVRRAPQGHSPVFLVDPQGVTGYAAALDSTVRILLDSLRSPPVPPASAAAAGEGSGFIINDNPVGQATIAIGQPLGGAFNTMVAAYAVHECATGLDHYVVTSLADWTPGSTYMSAFGSGINMPPTGEGPQSVNTWMSEFIPACGAESTVDIPTPYQNLPNDMSVKKDNSACEFVDYPLSYDVQMIPPTTGTITQVDASPEATQGTSTSYSSGFSFSIDGNVGWFGAASIAADVGASWDSETSTTVPAMFIEAGNIGNEGATWSFNYCTEQKGTDCTQQSIQPANPTHTCQNALGFPQNGQTIDGKFSNGGQMVHWTAAADTRVGDTFDVTVNFTANLANTQMLVWGSDSAGFGITGGTCNTVNEPFSGWCACDVATTQVAVPGAFTFEIPFPPDAQSSTCTLPCCASVPPSKKDPGCICVCPSTNCPTSS